MSDIVESDIVERLIDGDDLTSRIEAAALIKRLRADLKVAGAESAALQAGLVDAIFQKKKTC